MNFQEVYARMNEPLQPSPALVEQVLRRTKHRRPWRRLAAAAIAATLLLATPALAVRTEIGYQLLYRMSPAAAQFFQPVQIRCTDQGVTMEVIAVQVKGDTAQAYITFTGGTVDATTDLFDSYSFHLPFDQTGHCERVGWDEATGTVTFLCTVQTMDGSPIPTGRKMTFSARQLLTGKKALENAEVNLNLGDYLSEAETAFTWKPDDQATGQEQPTDAFFRTGGGGDLDLADTMPMLLPGPVLAEPAKGLTITAAGYAGGLFHIQLCRGNATQLDNHGRLWLEAADGTQIEPLCSAAFASSGQADRLDYDQFAFDVAPADLVGYTLRGDFYTSSTLIEGLWQVTFPLENNF